MFNPPQRFFFQHLLRNDIHAYLRDVFKVVLAESTVFRVNQDVETIKRKTASR